MVSGVVKSKNYVDNLKCRAIQVKAITNCTININQTQGKNKRLCVMRLGQFNLDLGDQISIENTTSDF